MDLICNLTPDRRRVFDVLVRRVGVVEEAHGEAAALLLIDDVVSIVDGSDVRH